MVFMVITSREMTINFCHFYNDIHSIYLVILVDKYIPFF